MRRWSHADQRRQALAVLAATGQTLAPNSSAATECRRTRALSASRIRHRRAYGRGSCGSAVTKLAWTDGSSIFVDPDAEPGHQLASVAVQAALLGAGSLDQQVTAALAPPPERWLAAISPLRATAPCRCTKRCCPHRYDGLSIGTSRGARTLRRHRWRLRAAVMTLTTLRPSSGRSGLAT